MYVAFGVVVLIISTAIFNIFGFAYGLLFLGLMLIAGKLQQIYELLNARTPDPEEIARRQLIDQLQQEMKE